MGTFPPMPGSADAVFAEWLKRRGEPEPDSFDSLLQVHPEQAGALVALHAQWQRLEPMLRLAGFDPAAPASFAERLRAAHGPEVDPGISLDAPSSDLGKASSELLKRLGKKSPGSRYRLEGEVARGGMGAILRVWDEDIRRHLAMKVVLGRGDPATEGGTPAVEPSQLARFLEEAQVTGQLDHPGIVPVHELGIDKDGRVFFTMKLVKGRDLRSIYDLVFEGKEGWNETRALTVLLKVCEAVAYAHKKGVIHRDLKPANVMVGDFGEVYVMDWGLARVVGRKDAHDMRIAPEATASKSVQTERREERAESPDSPIVTMDGIAVGTAAYMSPEQALCEVEKLGPRSDVYAIGAMIYHLLSRQPPYIPPGARIEHWMVLRHVQAGPPQPLSSLRKGVAPELVAICEKAMAREEQNRYADTLLLRDDLRAYLERRVVRAYETGTWAETKKWVSRNAPLALSFCAVLVCALAGAIGFAIKAREANAQTEAAKGSEARATRASEIALEHATRAQRLQAEADAQRVEAQQSGYLASVIAAEAALTQSSIQSFVGLLDRAPAEPRNWEWGYLNSSVFRLSHTKAAILSDEGVWRFDSNQGEGATPTPDMLATSGFKRLCTLGNASLRLISASVSPDSTRLIAGSSDHNAYIFDLRSGATLGALQGHAGPVVGIAFDSLGGRVATASDDHTARVWDALTGQELIQLRGHSDRVTSCSFSPTGAHIVTGSADGTAKIWDTRTGVAIQSLGPQKGEVTVARFDPDEERILTASNDGGVRIWESQTGTTLRWMSGTCPARNAADGTIAVANSGAVVVWDFTSEHRTMRQIGDHKNGIASISLSPDGTRLATGGVDGSILVWDAATSALVARLTRHYGRVSSVAFSKDGALLISASDDGTVRVWDSVSCVDRATQRREVDLADKAARALVSELARSSTDWSALAHTLQHDLRASEPLRLAALNALTRMATSASAARGDPPPLDTEERPR